MVELCSSFSTLGITQNIVLVLLLLNENVLTVFTVDFSGGTRRGRRVPF